MKRCPECRRDYFDDSLLYCLDDGTALLEGPASDDTAKTAIMSGQHDASGPTVLLGGSPLLSKPSRQRSAFQFLVGITAIIAVGLGVYWLWFRDNRPELIGSFREVGSPAYDYYLRGKLDSISQNRERNQNAIEILEKVVTADPGFAPAYAGLARAYAIKADLFDHSDQRKLYDDAKVAVEKALAIDPSLAEAHLARGAITWNHVNRFPHEQTIQSYKKSIALNPNVDESHHLLGLVYYHIGMFDKSEHTLRRALELDPSNALARFRIGQVMALRTDYKEALAVFKTVPREANSAVIDRAMAGVLFQIGRNDEAWQIVDEYLMKDRDDGGNVTSVKAMLLARAGRAAEAEEAIRRSIEIGQRFQHFHHASYNIASTYAIINKNEEALKWLRFTAEEGFPCYPLFEKDENLNSLRQDERFISLMEELKQQWERHNATL